MSETRANPVTGSLEVKHPDLNIWVPAIVPLLVNGGWEVALNAIQANLLNSLKTNSDQLPDLISKTQEVKVAIEQLQLQLQNINQVTLDGMQSSLTEVESYQEAILSDLMTVKGLLNAGGAIQTLLTAIASSNTSQNGLLEVLNAEMVVIKNNLNTVNTNLNAVNTNLNAVNTNLDRLTPGVCAITQVTLASANTQYTFTVPSGTKRIAFKCRGDRSKPDPVGDIRYAWTTGVVASGTNSYDVLPEGAEESDQQFFGSSQVLHLASSVAGVVVAIRRWS